MDEHIFSTTALSDTGESTEFGRASDFTPSAGRADNAVPDDLSDAERAVWRDPALVARVEAILEDPSLAVPLEEPSRTAAR